MRSKKLSGDRRGVIAVFFALAIVPLMIVVSMAVDYAFAIQARAQLNLAADAAAMYAVRVASQDFFSTNGTTLAAAEDAGVAAGQQWFAAQLGQLTSATVPANNVTVTVTETTAPPGFSATVSYSGTVSTVLGQFIQSSWNISDSATSVISNGYVEVVFLIDNSSSMLLAATVPDMVRLEQATICSTQSAAADQPMDSYAWIYAPTPYGYNAYMYNGDATAHLWTGLIPPPADAQKGACDKNYDGDGRLCFYIPSANPPISPSTGLCNNKPPGGSGGVFKQEVLHTPQAPCAFACHTDATGSGNDYYALSQSLVPPVQLRLNVVHQAAASAIQALLNVEEVANEFSVGIYEFNSTLQQQFPLPGNGEASTDLTSAIAAAQALAPPLSPPNSQGVPNTYFSVAANALNDIVSPAGDGSTVNSPQKYLFIVTDGMGDTSVGGNQVLGPVTSSTNEQLCQLFKNKGFQVYVLYTDYYPIPTPTYINSIKPLLKQGQITAALQACASSSSTNYIEAGDPDAINAAMQQMVGAVLTSSTRIAH